MILCKFKCKCISEDATFSVRFRGKDESVVDWMEHAVRPNLGFAHKLMSPKCREPKVEYVGIPAPDDAPILGGKPC